MGIKHFVGLLSAVCLFTGGGLGGMAWQPPSSPLDDWPQFRGPNSSGQGTGSVPIEFGPGVNEMWHVDLKPGHSSPCIIGDSIFVTTFDQEMNQLAVVCLDRTTGKETWQYQLSVDQLETGHPSFNPASSTPASDGQRVVAYFGSYGLICLSMDGSKLWEMQLPLAKSFGGNAASPVIVDDRVVLYRGSYIDHYLLAVDKQTGEEIWKVPQLEPFTGEMACTACPIVSGDNLILHSARSVQAIEIATGKQIWMTKCATTATSTPVLAGNEVIVAAWNKMGEPDLRPEIPSYETMLASHDQDADKQISANEFPEIWIFHRPDGSEAPLNGLPISFESVDKDSDRRISETEWTKQTQEIVKFRGQYAAHGLLAIPIDQHGIISPEKIRTLETEGIPEVPSPLYDGTYIYFVKNGGVITCLDLATGKRVYRTRTGGRGTHYASPIMADGKIYSAAGDGRISVIKSGPIPVVLATNEMQDEVYATPAIVDGVLFVRTHSALFAFRNSR